MKKPFLFFAAICCLVTGCTKESAEEAVTEEVSAAANRALGSIPLICGVDLFNLSGTGTQEWSINSITFNGVNESGNSVTRTLTAGTAGFTSTGNTIGTSTIYNNSSFTWGIYQLNSVEVDFQSLKFNVPAATEHYTFIHIEDYPGDYGAVLFTSITDKLNQRFSLEVQTPDAIDLQQVQVVIKLESL
ncbi:MAG: hypothetical protein LIO79_03070 [Rikenellaceae bacterium]|nr:hypothetical protein [Rikenellaceae bacterium]